MKKRYTSNRIIRSLFFCTMLIACDGIFIPDPIDPHLPKYTETGNRVAGAILNEKIWKSHVRFSWGGANDAPHINYYSHQDSLVITFTGQKRGEDFNTYIVFSLLNTGVSNVEDLRQLNDKKFDLGSPNYGGYILSQGNYDCITSGMGQVYFRSVKYSDNNDNKRSIILSGTFGFDVEDPVCGKTSVRYGRFDYSISNLYYN